MSGLTLDAGGLIAAERGNERVIALLEAAIARGSDVAVPGGALAQVWRAHPAQHHLHELLADERVHVVALDRDEALLVGSLCAFSGVADIVDVSVVACAGRRGHAIVTTDPDDLAAIDPSLPLIVP